MLLHNIHLSSTPSRSSQKNTSRQIVWFCSVCCFCSFFFFSIFVFTKIRVRIFSEAFKSDERMRCFQRLGLETSKRPWQVWKIFDKGVGGGVQTLIQKTQNFYLFFSFRFLHQSLNMQRKNSRLVNFEYFWLGF